MALFLVVLFCVLLFFCGYLIAALRSANDELAVLRGTTRHFVDADTSSWDSVDNSVEKGENVG